MPRSPSALSRRTRAAGLVALVLVLLPLQPLRPAHGRAAGEGRTFAGCGGHRRPPLLDLDLDAGGVGVGLHLGLRAGGHRHACPPPPTTTTTTTTPTTRTAPPPPAPTTTTTAPSPAPPPPPTTTTAPPPPPLPRRGSVPPPPPATTTTSTTTTVPSPPRPPAPRPPRLTIAAAFSPQRPGRGQLATVGIEVRNDGEGAAGDLVLTDEVSRTTELRSATSPDGDCTVAGRTATCRLGRLAPGQVATVVVRVKVVRDPASGTLVQHISLSTGEQDDLAQRSFSTLVDPGPPRGLALLDLPGPTATVVALVTLTLAARPGTMSRSPRRRRQSTGGLPGR